MGDHSVLDILTAESQPRILLIRLHTIGDVLAASPVPQVLREAMPRARISWMVEPSAAPFVQCNPYLDEVIIREDPEGWRDLLREGKLLALWRKAKALRRELRERAFDLVIDLQGSRESAWIARASGAPRRIGALPGRTGRHLCLTDRGERPPHPTRFTQTALALLAPLGLSTTPRTPVLPVPDDERERAQGFLAANGLAGKRYVACVISTGQPQKAWVWSRWRELAEALWTRDGMRTVLIGGPAWRVDALQSIEGSQAGIVTAVGHTSLLQSAAIVQDAALVVGGDTGLTFAGLATGTPTVVLYGATDPDGMTEEPLTGVCFHPMPCSPCGARPTCAGYECMQAISVAEVLDAVTRLGERCKANV